MAARYAGLPCHAFDACPTKVKRCAEPAVYEGRLFLLLAVFVVSHALEARAAEKQETAPLLQRFPADGTSGFRWIPRALVFGALGFLESHPLPYDALRSAAGRLPSQSTGQEQLFKRV